MDASAAVAPSVEAPLNNRDGDFDSKPALTPPTSEDMGRREERMSSELSELESDDDGEEIEPDHYFEGGKIPVFKPVCRPSPAQRCVRYSERRHAVACAPVYLFILTALCCRQ